MKGLSTVRRRASVLLAGSLLALIVPACHGGPGPESRPRQGYSLAMTRPSGDWQPPRDPEERRRLDGVVKEHYDAFQECQWRHAGKTLSSVTPSPSDSLAASAPNPLVGRFGVDPAGTVVWLELSPEATRQNGLRECLSERLLRIRFEPPPSQPVMLVFTLSRVRSHRVSWLEPRVPDPGTDGAAPL